MDTDLKQNPQIIISKVNDARQNVHAFTPRSAGTSSCTLPSSRAAWSAACEDRAEKVLLIGVCCPLSGCMLESSYCSGSSPDGSMTVLFSMIYQCTVVIGLRLGKKKYTGSGFHSMDTDVILYCKGQDGCGAPAGRSIEHQRDEMLSRGS